MGGAERTRRGRRKLALALAGIAVVAGGAYAAHGVWRDRTARLTRALHEAGVKQHRADLAAFERCLTGERAAPDLVTGLLFHLNEVIGRDDLDACEAGADALVSAMLETARNLDVEIASWFSAPRLVLLRRVEQLAALCRWIGLAHRALDALDAGAGEQKTGAPACDVGAHPLALVRMPPELRADPARQELHTGTALVVSHHYNDYPGRTVVARTTDGERWDVRTLPPRPREYSWTRHGLAAVTLANEQAPWVVHVDDGGTWSQRGKLRLAGLHSIEVVERGLTVVGFEREIGSTYSVLHSTDGGRTFSRPISVVDDRRRDVAVWALPDQTAIAFAATEEGPARFDVTRYAPGARVPVRASLTWNETGDMPRSLELCGYYDTIWALIRKRHLVVSHDAGATWREVSDLGAALDHPRVSCSATRAVLYSRVERDAPAAPLRQLRSCDDRACGAPLDAPLDEHAMVAIAMNPRPELWVGLDMDVHQRAGRPLALLVYRIEDARVVPDRIHIAEDTRDTLPVVRAGGEHVRMYDVVGMFSRTL